jgi:hypothetical protein
VCVSVVYVATGAIEIALSFSCHFFFCVGGTAQESDSNRKDFAHMLALKHTQTQLEHTQTHGERACEGDNERAREIYGTSEKRAKARERDALLFYWERGMDTGVGTEKKHANTPRTPPGAEGEGGGVRRGWCGCGLAGVSRSLGVHTVVVERGFSSCMCDCRQRTQAELFFFF